MKRLIFLLLFVSSVSFGQVVQNFSLTNVTDGKVISLDDYSSYAGVVIIFTSNNCPYDGYYLNRIKTLAQTYQSKLPLLLINAHTDDNESVDYMKNYAEQCKLPMPYLADKEQKVLANLSAKKSPECFLLQQTGGKFKVVYRGAIDDNAQSANDVDHFYLKDAMEKLLAKQKIEVPDVRPVGCSIRKNN
jgi:peroxiredoxin